MSGRSVLRLWFTRKLFLNIIITVATYDTQFDPHFICAHELCNIWRLRFDAQLNSVLGVRPHSFSRGLCNAQLSPLPMKNRRVVDCMRYFVYQYIWMSPCIRDAWLRYFVIALAKSNQFSRERTRSSVRSLKRIGCSLPICRKISRDCVGARKSYRGFERQ